MSDKLLKKIEMMLRKAESTPYPAEAETFMAAAEKLMLRHGIDRAMLESADEAKREKVVVLKVKLEGMWQTAWSRGFGNVVSALGLRPLQSKHSGATWLWVVGHESDAKDAVTIIESLRTQSFVALGVWWKEYLPDHRYLTNHERHVAKRSFMESFGDGAAARIREERQTAVEETEGTGAELVLVSRTAEIDDYIASTMNVGKGRARNDQWNASGSAAGRAAGRNAATSSRRHVNA